MNLSELRAANISRNAIWDPKGELHADFFINELLGEVGELANLLKKVERERLGIGGSRATKEQIAEECADVIICIDLLNMSLNQPSDEWAPASVYSGAKIDLGYYLGKIYVAYCEGNYDPIRYFGRHLCYAVDAIARGFGYTDIREEVKKKFNSTSRKYNLPIFIGEVAAIDKLHPDVP